MTALDLFYDVCALAGLSPFRCEFSTARAGLFEFFTSDTLTGKQRAAIRRKAGAFAPGVVIVDELDRRLWLAKHHKRAA